jgi:rod shape determining protein RodA
LSALGLVVIFSASGENWSVMARQGLRLGISLVVMVAVAQVSPENLRRFSPHLFAVGVILLVAVLVMGAAGKGAQRWLDLGLVRFQPSELMKLGVPMVVAWLLTRSQVPPRFAIVLLALALTLIPASLVVVQPDLGTAIMLVVSGLFVLFLAGIRWQHVLMMLAAVTAVAPYLWFRLQEYQRQRILTLFDPWADPMGSGYQAIQSQIAIGSAGISGKGWLAGSQSHLEFIPERSAYAAVDLSFCSGSLPGDGVPYAGDFLTIIDRQFGTDFLFLCFCQSRYGLRYPSYRGGATSTDQLRRYIDAYTDGSIWNYHGPSRQA